MSDHLNGVRTLLICGDFSQTSYGAVEQYIKDSADVLAYWNHIPLVYAIKTRLAAAQIGPKLRMFFGDSRFLLIEINIYNAEGYLPQDAWNWFTTPAPLQKPTDPPYSQLQALYAARLPRE